MDKRQTGFTVIEFLVALVIIGFIVTLLVSLFSNPLKEASQAHKVRQVEEGLRQLSDAVTIYVTRYSPDDPYGILQDLQAKGLLHGIPPFPSDIGDASGYYGAEQALGPWGLSRERQGGCGASNLGATRTDVLELWYIGDDFCKTYNAEHGLGSVIIGNCSSAPDAACTAAGSTSASDPPGIKSATFCYDHNGTNMIMFNTGIPDGVCD